MRKKLIKALKECIAYIEDDIEANIVGLSTEAEVRAWLADIKALVAALAIDRMEIEGRMTIRIEKLMCEKLGRAWTPDGISIVTLIDELYRAAPASAEPVGWQARRKQEFLDKYPQASEYVMTLYSTEYEARASTISSTDLVFGNVPQSLIDAVIVRPVYAGFYSQ